MFWFIHAKNSNEKQLLVVKFRYETTCTSNEINMLKVTSMLRMKTKKTAKNVDDKAMLSIKI